MSLVKRAAYWTWCDQARAYYFRPVQAKPPPYLAQIEVTAILDVAADGTLAGVEIIDSRVPPPPSDGAILEAEE